MLKHLIAYVLMTIILGVMVVSASFLANDLVENKILLGKPLQPIQATLLLVNEDYLETSFEDNELLTENQRKRVRLGVIIGGAIFMLILTAGVAGGWYSMSGFFSRSTNACASRCSAKQSICL